MAAPVRYRFPLDTGTYEQGRIDEGVDFSTRAGSAIRAMGSGVVDFVGKYSGFGNYFAYHLTEGPAAGQEIFVAEHAQTLVKRGQRIRGGQKIAVAAGGLETGYAQRSGTFLPEANPNYTEGQVTLPGRRFAEFLKTGVGQPPGDTLGQLWIKNGGPPKVANLMAAIALAESGGKVDNTGGPNRDGSYDYGLWMINSNIPCMTLSVC